ncbi:MAG TPA: ABC transporter permease [Bryobacteraceae bacterium]|nr:ABC transporter permease [Bryobacteraceae bacterium]
MLRQFWIDLKVRVAALFSRGSLHSRAGEELRFHLRELEERKIESGVAPEDARIQARRELGNIALLSEQTVDSWRYPFVDILVQDIRYALRGLRRDKAFSATAFLLLALAIGANTAVFTVVKRVLLDPLPYPESDRLVRIWSAHTQTGSAYSVSALDYQDWAAQSKSFDAIAAFGGRGMTITGEGEPELVIGLGVSANLFHTLGVQPMLGRDFRAAENADGTDRILILSYALWQRKFDGRPEVVGRTIHIDGQPLQVIGVMPPHFGFPDASYAAWRPLALKGGDPNWFNRSAHFLRVVGRLKPSVTMASATAEMSGIARQLERAYPGTNSQVGVQLRSLKEWMVGDSKALVFTLYGAVTLLLLIVCSNLAGLLIARAAARRAEFATRAALGATRLRLMGQMTVEAALLSLTGGSAGVALANALLSLAKARAAGALPRLDELALDPGVLLFSLALTLATSILFGVLPAAQLPRLVQTSRGTAARGLLRRVRPVLVGGQVALAAILLAGAGLFLRSLHNLSHVNLGFEPRDVLTANFVLAENSYPTSAKMFRFTRELDEYLASAPAVLAAGFSTTLPLSGQEWGNPIRVNGHPFPPGRSDIATIQCVSPGFLPALQSPLKLGRQLTDRDNAHAPLVLLVDDTFVAAFLPSGESPIGKMVRIGDSESNDPWRTIVGVVGSYRQSSLDGPLQPQMFLPYAQLGERTATMVGRGLYLALRTSAPAAAAGMLKAKIASLDQALAVRDIRPLTSSVDAALSSQSLRSSLIASFAGLALLLAGVGLYGVIAFAVAQRTQEIGVRMALGARPSQIAKLILADGARLGMIGIALGIGVTLSLSKVAEHLLFGVSGHDLATLSTTAAILVIVTLLASYVPARRAAAIDPGRTIREE